MSFENYKPFGEVASMDDFFEPDPDDELEMQQEQDEEQAMMDAAIAQEYEAEAEKAPRGTNRAAESETTANGNLCFKCDKTGHFA